MTVFAVWKVGETYESATGSDGTRFGALCFSCRLFLCQRKKVVQRRHL